MIRISGMSGPTRCSINRLDKITNDWIGADLKRFSVGSRGVPPMSQNCHSSDCYIHPIGTSGELFPAENVMRIRGLSHLAR